MNYRVLKDVMVPMRDGVKLAADVWIPDGAGPAPVVLVRTPYSKDDPALFAPNMMADPLSLVAAGYVVVVQDCRGTFRSAGEFTGVFPEALDGADTIAWIARQPWCDGNIGTRGSSYLGMAQWSLAAQAPEQLKAIAPSVTSADYYEAFYSPGGALSLRLLWTFCIFMAMGSAGRAVSVGESGPENLTRFVDMLIDSHGHPDTMPYGTQPLLEQQLPWWSEVVAHPDRDDYWRDHSAAERFGDVRTPALHIGGWFDFFLGHTVRSFTELQRAGATAEARTGQRLIIGPWDHGSYTGVYQERQFGPSANPVSAEINARYVEFYDRWLRGRADALKGTAPVRIFVMGIDEWRDEQAWPLPDTEYVQYYLDSSGRAHTADGDGTLSPEPAAREVADVYLYDPKQPVATLGGRVGPVPFAPDEAGPADQRPVEQRQDVLCFSTPVLQEPIEVTGHVTLVLHVASSAHDTDFTGKLVDVYPDGRALYLTDGILRARYRNSLSEPELLEPDKTYEITLDLSVTSNVFLPGHRIRLEVSSSNFPRYDRNTNTGGVISQDTEDEAVVAVNRVLHGPDHPSRLILPIISR